MHTPKRRNVDTERNAGIILEWEKEQETWDTTIVFSWDRQ